MRSHRQWGTTTPIPYGGISIPNTWTLKFQEEFNAPVNVAQQGSASPFVWTDHLWYVVDWHNDSNGWPAGDGTVNLNTVYPVSNGICTINAQTITGGTWVGSTLASVNSSGVGFSQQYGFFESKIKMTKGNGLWPAFWLYNLHKVTDGTAPAAEIDIMEFYGSDYMHYYGTYHSYATGTHVFNSNNQVSMGIDMSLDWHTFAVYWDSSNVVWYCDGVQRITNPTLSDQNTPMFIIINHATGGGVSPDGTTPNPAPMLIEYVRAWGP